MVLDEKPSLERWIVEPSRENNRVSSDVESHLTEILKDWAQTMPRFLEAANFDTEVCPRRCRPPCLAICRVWDRHGYRGRLLPPQVPRRR